MKTILTLTLALIIGTVSYAQKTEKKTVVIKTTIHCNHCLQCESCAMNINESIRTLSGVSKVKIQPELQNIEVTYRSDKTDADAIRNQIAAAGFDADDVKATEEGYAKLDGCCKAK